MPETHTAEENAPPRFDEAVDVVVVGSGSAGAAAALRLAKAGLSVLMLEKTERLGGTSAMSGRGRLGSGEPSRSRSRDCG